MNKTAKRRLKRLRKCFAETLWISLPLGIIQFACLLFFLLVLLFCHPISSDEMHSETIVITKMDYEYVVPHGLLFLYSDVGKFEYPRWASDYGYSRKELEKELKEGDTIEILWVESRSYWAKFRRIVDARSGNQIYLSPEGYNKYLISIRKNTVIICSVVEAVLITLFVILFIGNLKPNNYKRKKTKKRLRVQKTETAKRR